LREKLFRFFSGRNGPDALGQATSFVCVALILLNLFVGSYVLYALELLLMAVWVFRLFSRNTARRRAEEGRLAILPVTDCHMEQWSQLVHHRDKVLTPQIRVMVSCIAQVEKIPLHLES